VWLGLGWGTFTCVWWQVTLCDPIWQMMPRSSEMVFHEELYTPLTLFKHDMLRSNCVHVEYWPNILTLSDRLIFKMH